MIAFMCLSKKPQNEARKHKKFSRQWAINSASLNFQLLVNEISIPRHERGKNYEENEQQ
jgi:hypothetical protein